MEGDGVVEMIVIDRFDAAHPGEDCGGMEQTRPADREVRWNLRTHLSLAQEPSLTVVGGHVPARRQHYKGLRSM